MPINVTVTNSGIYNKNIIFYIYNGTSRLSWVPNHLGTWLESHEIKKTSVVTGIEPTTSGFLDQRHSRSDNQALSNLARFVINIFEFWQI